MSRTTDLGDSASASTQGWLCRYISKVGLEQLLQRLGPADVLQQLHPLVVLDALGLHLGHGLAAGLELLGVEHLARVVQRRLEHRDDVQGVARGLRVEHVEGRERERRQRLVQREVGLQVHGQPHRAAGLVRRVQPLDHPGGEQAAVHVDRLAHQAVLGARLLVVVAQQRAHRRERVAGAGDDVEQGGVADPHPGDHRLGLGRHQLVEGLLAPGDRALRGLLALDLAPLLGVVTGLGERPLVLDDVLGRLHHDGARGVVAGPAGPPGDLVELARLEDALAAAVVLGQRR